MQLGEASARLLGRTIGAIQGPDFQPGLLRWLLSCLDFDALTTIAYFAHSPPTALHLWARDAATHRLVETAYLTNAYLIDPFHELHRGPAAEGVYRLHDIAPDQFQRSQYYKAYFRHTGVTDEIGMLVRPRAGTSVITSLSRSHPGRRSFSPRERRVIATAFPIYHAMASRHYRSLEAPGERGPDGPHTVMKRALARQYGISLSPRQAEVAVLVLKGHSSTAIGALLGISPQTVKVFRKQIYQRCNISSQAELFRMLLPLLH